MSSPIFKVIKPGLQTTVQDLGRRGFQQFGISPFGAMDSYSMQMANLLAGNPAGEAVLEAAFIGPQLEALRDLTLAICGGDFSLTVDEKKVAMWKSFLLKKGQILTIGQCRKGARAYIAISGGIQVPAVLTSKSTFLHGEFGGFEGRALQKEDILYGNPVIRKLCKSVHPELIPHYDQLCHVRVILGPHHDLFSKQSMERFFTEEYVVSPRSNRMGYQLTGPRLEHLKGPDIISDPIPLGGIQVPASGQPIILMADHQTTGGYTRIGTVISVDIPVLAQAAPGTKVRFTEIPLHEAQNLYMKRRTLFKQLEAAIK